MDLYNNGKIENIRSETCYNSTNSRIEHFKSVGKELFWWIIILQFNSTIITVILFYNIANRTMKYEELSYLINSDDNIKNTHQNKQDTSMKLESIDNNKTLNLSSKLVLSQENSINSIHSLSSKREEISTKSEADHLICRYSSIPLEKSIIPSESVI